MWSSLTSYFYANPEDQSSAAETTAPPTDKSPHDTSPSAKSDKENENVVITEVELDDSAWLLLQTDSLPPPSEEDSPDWQVTPPPCFNAQADSLPPLTSSQLENALIEHASMSVYVSESSPEQSSEVQPADQAVAERVAPRVQNRKRVRHNSGPKPNTLAPSKKDLKRSNVLGRERASHVRSGGAIFQPYQRRV